MAEIHANSPAADGAMSAAPPHRWFLPELLAPAGDWECARAAVENGADAVYFGLAKFNARMRARNFTEADLSKLMEFLHRRGVKGYVTFNTLIFANEIAQAEQYLRAIISAGVDAAIVQDVGICRLIRRLSPDFPIHCSTQMTITSAGGVEFARELGCNLVVLARECSIKEIDKIRAAAAENSPLVSHSPLPLEVFVHGALCVAYSGQCLTSEALGGRSANRGECAQACRMPYELVCDGRVVPLGDRRYLLSPQDLAGLEVLPDLVRAGVASLKIEGRLKTPEYVANITRVYRQALDRVFVELGQTHSDDTDENLMRKIRTEASYDLEMAFSRGLYTGWLRGINNQELVHARFGKKRGVYLGEVDRIQGERVFVKLMAPLKPGDGVVFDAGHPEEEEEGGRVYTAESRGRETLIGFGHGDIDFCRVHVGDKLWKTSDPKLERRLRQTFSGERPHFQRAITIEVHGRADRPMTVVARDQAGCIVQVSSSMPLAKAQRQPLTTECLGEHLGRLGGTSLVLRDLESCLEGDVILPLSELNRLRRELVGQLETERAQPRRWVLNELTHHSGADGVSLHDRSNPGSHGTHRQNVYAPGQPEIIVLVRNLEQLEAALDCGVQTLYCEFEDPKRYRAAVARFRARQGMTPSPSATGKRDSAIFAAPPRIFKMGEEWILKQVRSCEADGYLIRNYDHLRFFSDSRRIGDFSLNVANPLTAEYFIKRFGLERVTASYDLNFVQLEALLQSASPGWFEVTIHQHMPMFHMEHCVFCAFLSKGTDYTNCGRPCDKHEVKLRDRIGAEHVLKADAGCRNTVFNALPQSGAEYLERMLKLGVRHFRIEFVNESGDQVTGTLSEYHDLLRGKITGGEVWRKLKLLNQLGVTRGQIEKVER
jgi:putative protease